MSAKKTLADILPVAPKPESPLSRYRLLSPTAAVRVSPLCLGAMNFGSAWGDYMGHVTVDDVEGILDYFYSQGGNFIDTANNYQDNESETWIGNWMKKRGNRDEMVIATKYTTNYYAGHKDKLLINYNGNGSKSLHVSVKDSLKKLQTDYIDLLYVHWYDYSAGVEEMMQSLNHLVTSGKVLYLGVSDTPAWVVSKANQYARDHGLRQFSVYQGRWSAASRDFERDIIPMTRSEGMGLCPWGALGGGKFKTDEQWKAAEKEGGRGAQPAEADKKISIVLEGIAKEKGTIITSVAQAYVMHKTPYVFPIIGGRKIDHLKGNIEALKLQLSQEDIDKIDQAVPFEMGFPHNFLWAANKVPKNLGEVTLLGMGGTTDYVEGPRPIAISSRDSK